jgi:ribosome-binding factor A
MKSHRLARVNEVVREVAAETILFELKDPRVKNVTVTRAEVSADLQHAKVYVSVMGTEKEQNLTMHGLKASAGFIQAKLAKRLTSRYVPHVTFVVDEGVKKSLEIARLLREELGPTAPVADSAAADTEESDEADEADEAAEADQDVAPGGAPPSDPRAGPADGPADR